MSTDVFSDRQRELAAAKERLEEIRAAWHEEGRPLLASGSMGQVIEHPLVRMLRDHERLVADLGERLAKRHRGPEPSAVLGGGRVRKAGSAKLRAAS